MAERDGFMVQDGEHCDDLIGRPWLPRCLRWFLLYNRLPAVERCLMAESGVREPQLYANYPALQNKRVRVVMASRFGDVGITERLDHTNGYQVRVRVCELTNFGSTQ